MKISVIVPVYNVIDYIKECIDSVLNQTYSDWELILIDDLSTDGSAEYCDAVADKDSRIKCIHNNNGYNRGVSKSRNIGLDIAEGDLILFLDSDDYIAPDLLECAVKSISEYGLDVYIYSYKSFENGDEIKDIVNSEKTEFYNSEQAIKEVLLGRKFRGICWNKVCKRSVYDSIKFPEGRRYGEDIYVTYRLMRNAKRIMYINKQLYFYRIHENSTMHGIIEKDVITRVKAYEEFIEWTEKYYKHFLELAYKAYCNIVAETTLMLKKSNKNTRQIVMENISDSVRCRKDKIMQCDNIPLITKMYIKLYGLTHHMYRVTYVYMAYKGRGNLRTIIERIYIHWRKK